MTSLREYYEQNPNLSIVLPQKDWPTMYDLPSEYPEDPGFPDEFHAWQAEFLSETFQLKKVAKDQVLISKNLNLHYDFKTPDSHIRPDWFAVVGVPRLYDSKDLRLSYVVWDEQVSPAIVVELISPGTLMADLGEVRREQNGTPNKFQIYEKILKVPNYIVFDRYKDRLWVFKLINGHYQEQEIIDGKFWFDALGIGIGTWHGSFKGFTRLWLRWYDVNEDSMRTDSAKARKSRCNRQQQEGIQAQSHQMEALVQERSRRIEAEQMAVQERSRADRLAERLRSLGIDPDEV